MLRIIFGILFIALATVGHAQTLGGPAQDNFYVNIGSLTSAPNLDDNAVSQTASQVIDITKTNLILLVAGQSLKVNVAPSVYSPANASSIFQINIYNGKIYPAGDPLLGTTTGAGLGPGNPMTRVADTIVTNASFQRVYVEDFAVGNTAVADWQTGVESPLIPVAVLRLKSKGINCGTTNIKCVFIWDQGPNDTTLGTSQAAYTTSLTAVLAQLTATGFSGHVYIAEDTYNATTTSAGIQAAQASFVNGTTVFAAENVDALVGSVCGAGLNLACRNSTDHIHWTDAGSLTDAAALVTKLNAGGF
jgi:hypothetical protein